MSEFENGNVTLSNAVHQLHLHRYALACDQITGLSVLDIGSGDGSGAALLATRAATVTGVNSNPAHTAEASGRFSGSPRLSFMTAEATALPFPDDYFDAVIAFGTDWTKTSDTALAEIRRVLKSSGFAMLRTPAPAAIGTDEFGAAVRRNFKHRFALGQRIIAASSIGPASHTANPNAADYRGYTLAPGAGLTAGVVRMKHPDQIVWVVSQTALPRAENTDSLFLDPVNDLWASIHCTGTAPAESATDAARRAIASSDMSIVAALVEQVSGTPVAGDLASLALALSQTNVRLAVQDVQLSEISRLDAALSTSEQGCRRLAERLEESQSDATAARTLAMENRHLSERLSEHLAIATRDAEAQRQIIDEGHDQIQTLALGLERARHDTELTQLQIDKVNAEADVVRAELQATLVKLELTQTEAAEVAAYRAGFAAAATIRGARRELTSTLSAAAGTSSRAPAFSPPIKIETGPARPISTGGRLRAALKRTLKSHEKPTAPLEALACLFDADHYVTANGVKPKPGETPFDHYVRSGRHQGLSTHPMIDAEWIRSTWPNSKKQPFDLFAYINDRRLHDLWPNPLFEADYYRNMNPDVAHSGVNSLVHYLNHGWREGRQPNQMFDNDWYLATHADVLAAGMNPLLHYFLFGASELRKPHPLFDHSFYLDQYPDVAASNTDGYAHFIAYGRAEGRLSCSKMLRLQRLESFFDGSSINTLLLGGEPEARLRRLDDQFWPPRPVDDYWLPQPLHDFITDRFGEDLLPLHAWLFSLINRYADAPDQFDTSAECERLIARVKRLANVPNIATPRVSIIIPAYNNLLYTLTCISSVLESLPTNSFEIIIGDDGSSDRTAEIIPSIGGLIRHVRHDKNLGFLGNCNAAAEKAAGDYIVFLNNDTIVFPGWLDQLIEAMKADKKIGFIGSKLLNGDGTLQEAGGLFWSDGSAWNFGRNGDPMAPEYNYLKDVDYVSGASIALPTKVWRRLGGFDPHFAPAYCEDSDLAFRVRQAGLRSVYHPHSVLVHHEGRSHGRDVTSGIKAYQVINSEKFLARWLEILKHENFDNAQHTFLARDRSAKKPHILIVDHYVPQWDRDAGSRTLYLYIKMFLKHGFAVTFWADNLHEDRTYATPLQAMGVEVIYSAAYRNSFDRWYADNAAYFDYAFLSRPHISENYIKTISAVGRAKIIYYGHDLHFKRLRAAFEITGDHALLAEADKWEQIEIEVCRLSNVVLYPGHEEVEEVRSRVPEGVSVLAFPITIFNDHDRAAGLDAVENGLERDPYALMFVGGFSHDPNVGGITWFVREVFPHLRRADPRFYIRIAGSNAPSEVLALEGEHVTVMGRISDEQLDALYASSGFAIVPLLYGGGVKGKVIEAMARGVPVVMTTVGAQGIPDAKAFSYVEDDPQHMAATLVAAVADRADALLRARHALDFIDQYYSMRAVKALLAPEIPELAVAIGEEVPFPDQNRT